jgi:hypothetical protein
MISCRGYRVYKNAPKHLKRMGMSESQRNAADAASFRMKMRWVDFNLPFIFLIKRLCLYLLYNFKTNRYEKDSF